MYIYIYKYVMGGITVQALCVIAGGLLISRDS